MSIDQLAAATKIPRRSLELLEEDRYDALPGPVFAKGFLRCAARALGVDVQTVMDLLYERERAALSARRRERPISTAVPAMLPDELTPARPTASAAPVVRPRDPQDAAVVEHVESPEPAPRRTRVANASPSVAEGSPPRRPKRLRARPSAGPGLAERMRARLPSPALFLWVVVAAFVAMVVLAAFNLVGGAAAGGPS
jgi:hypothetical protein